jgi:regulator of replication initiation timing
MSLFKKQEKPVEVTSRDLLKKVKALETKLEQTTKELGDLKREMSRAITKIGIKRFNPFKEIGGDQSFSIALLDEEHNGVIVTSYYGRELNRIYAKSVHNGTSKHELSGEEKEAISQATAMAKSK